MKGIIQALPIAILFAASSNLWADIDNGHDLHNEKCSSCHMMDDHEALYTRENRFVKDLRSLGGQVSACTQNLNIEWFPEEEKDVVNYLNKTYYHFK